MNSEDITVESQSRPPSSERLSVSSFALTDIGCKRLHNEDACLASNSKGLWAVADGMGGHDAGDLASRTLVHNLDRFTVPEQLDDCVAAIEQVVQETNTELNRIASETDTVTTIGTTLALLTARAGEGVVLWAGDSRVYRIRMGNIEQVTRDHSVINDLLDKGVIDSDEAEDHPDSNKITRSVGINNELTLDRRNVSIMPRDRYIICSDGLSRYISDEQINMLASLELSASSSSAGKALVSAALEARSSDNVTVVVIDFVEAR